jgi:heat shock protein HslJ
MTGRRFLALIAVAMMVAACSSANAGDETADGSGGELGATQWVLRSYDVSGTLTVVPDGQFVDANFISSRVSGTAGCNQYDALYRAGGRTLLVDFMTTTSRICDDASNAMEQAYIPLLQQSRFYNVNGRTLTIRDANLNVILIYDAAPNNPLLGDWLILSYNNGNGAVTTPVADSNPTATFGLRRLSGTTGCNSFQGDYNLNGDAVVIGPLARTQMACPDALMAQEQAIVTAFQGVGRVNYRGTIVELDSLTGSTQVQLIRPYAVPSPSASPSASASAAASASASAAPSASASASPSATPSPSPTPTATPTPTPTPTPTAAPTATPVATPTGTPAPTVPPPSSQPPTATCDLMSTAATPAKIATIVYPSNWFTVTTPANLACRYFSPTQITVPADPTTLKTAVMIQSDPALTYDAALAAATNPTAWNVLQQQPFTVGGLPATKIEATSTAGSPGYPPGVTRYGYLINVGGKAGWMVTSGTAGSAEYKTNTSVVDLMAAESTILTATPF